jgi:hypothetical protein
VRALDAQLEESHRRIAEAVRASAYNSTAPVEFSSGGRVVHRLSLRGNRQLNHAIHMAAVCQIRQSHSDGRLYFDRKLAEGKNRKEALRALKRRAPTPSTASWSSRQIVALERTTRERLDACVTGSHPETRLFG